MFALRIALVLGFLGCSMAAAEDLKKNLIGSKDSVKRQHEKAVENNYTLLRDEQHVRRFVEHGLLVKLQDTVDYQLHQVGFPYVRPATRLFLQRLSRQYRKACGERLVVTSATRPLNSQPWNASSKSVHPTGMALDFRIPSVFCRTWLEENLPILEQAGVVEVTWEKNPPHFHVAVYPMEYVRYVRIRQGGTFPPRRPPK